MDSNQEAPLDEIVWRSPQDIQEMGALHTNTSMIYSLQSDVPMLIKGEQYCITSHGHRSSTRHPIMRISSPKQCTMRTCSTLSRPVKHSREGCEQCRGSSSWSSKIPPRTTRSKIIAECGSSASRSGEKDRANLMKSYPYNVISLLGRISMLPRRSRACSTVAW